MTLRTEMKGILSFCLTVLEIAQFLLFASVASYWAVFILYPETKRRKMSPSYHSFEENKSFKFKNASSDCLAEAPIL